MLEEKDEDERANEQTNERTNERTNDFAFTFAFEFAFVFDFVVAFDDRRHLGSRFPLGDRMIGNACARQRTHGRLASAPGTCTRNVSIPCLDGDRRRCRRLLKPGLPGRVVCNSTSRPRPAAGVKLHQESVRACGHDQEQQEQGQAPGKDVARALPAPGSDAGDRQGAQSVNRRWKKTFL